MSYSIEVYSYTKKSSHPGGKLQRTPKLKNIVPKQLLKLLVFW